jgi:hypothetical protein
MRNDFGDQVKALRIEVKALQEMREELRSVMKADKARVIDLPNRRAN